jgi:glucokinase
MSIAADPVIGVDVGASTISAGLVRADGTVLATEQESTGANNPASTIVRLVEHVLALAGQHRLRVAGIGIGLPGPVDVESGRLRAVNGDWVPGLADVPLAVVVRERTGDRPVFVDNDANALALAEWMFGLGRGAASLVTIAVGTGIGGGIILDGALLRGRLNTAGEIGHVALDPDGPLCACGLRGCLTVYASGRLLPERARERLARFPRSRVLAEAGDDPQRITAALLFDAAAAGDPLARAVVDEACEALAVGVATLATLLNPDVIVLTGGVATSLAPLADDLRQRAGQRALPGLLDATAIHVVPADKRSTVRGGAALVCYELARRRRGWSEVTG